MSLKYLVLVTVCLTGFLNATPAPSSPAPHVPGLVDLGYAKHTPTFVNKTFSGHKVLIYKNIRFAKPPTGDLRFRWPDTDIDYTSSVQDGGARWDGQNCISSAPSSIPFPDISGRTWGQEDCLFLDVYVPEGIKPGDNVPVLHFIHGGAYAFGSKEFLTSPMGLFDHMLQQNLGKFIFVASNYRLGVLGWTYSNEEDMDSNVGLFDCLAAIKWTRKYISKFGGDGRRITASGQSAGAGIIYYMMTLFGGNGEKLPFKQAFLSSPAAPPRRNVKARQIELFRLVLKTANCTAVECLRSIPEHALIRVNNILINTVDSTGGGGVLGPIHGFGPAPDGEHTPDAPIALLQQGKIHYEVERLMIGTMANEGMGTSHDTGLPEYFPVMVRQIMPNASDTTIARIQSGYSWKQPAQLAWDWTTDIIWACNAYNLAKALPGKTRRYIMSTPPAIHGQDLFSYFYLDQDTTPVNNPSLARAFQTQLLQFIHGQELEWPLYGAAHKLFNITSDFEVAKLPVRLWKRCETINNLIMDRANGV